MKIDKFIVNVSAIISLGDTVLLMKRSMKEDKHPGLWGIPGGKIELRDGSVESALKREVKEEVGIEIKNIALFESHMKVNSDGDKKLYLVFTADYLTGTPTVSAEAEIIEWKRMNQLPDVDLFTPNTFALISDFFKRKEGKANGS